MNFYLNCAIIASFPFPLRTLSQLNVVLEGELKQRVSVPVLVKRNFKHVCSIYLRAFILHFTNWILKVQSSYFNVFKTFLKRSTYAVYLSFVRIKFPVNYIFISCI